MNKEEIEKLAWKSALTEFPYTDEGNLEDDIDAAKRKIHMGGFILGYKLASPQIDLEKYSLSEAKSEYRITSINLIEIEKVIRSEINVIVEMRQFLGGFKYTNAVKENERFELLAEYRKRIGYHLDDLIDTLSDLPKKEGEL